MLATPDSRLITLAISSPLNPVLPTSGRRPRLSATSAPVCASTATIYSNSVPFAARSMRPACLYKLFDTCLDSGISSNASRKAFVFTMDDTERLLTVRDIGTSGSFCPISLMFITRVLGEGRDGSLLGFRRSAMETHRHEKPCQNVLNR